MIQRLHSELGADLAGDLWGGLAAMLVALPSSLARLVFERLSFALAQRLRTADSELRVLEER